MTKRKIGKLVSPALVAMLSTQTGPLRAQSPAARDGVVAASTSPPSRLTATFLSSPPRLDLSDASGTVVVSHPLLKERSSGTPLRAVINPAQPLIEKRNRRAEPVHLTNAAGTVLYVLQSTSKFARVSAFDLTTGSALGDSDLGVATRSLQLNSDETRLIAYGPGLRFVGNAVGTIKPKERNMAVITVLDPGALQVKSVQHFGVDASLMRYVSKLDRMVVMDGTRSTMWFVDPRSTEAPPIKLGGMASGTVVSTNGALLLALVRNTNKSGKKAVKGGALKQFDIATGQLLHTSEKLGDAVQLIRLGDGDEYWVLMRGRMQRVSPNGEPADAIIPFQDADKGELGRGLGGIPGSSLAFGNRFAISVLKPDGSLTHKLALIDPESGRVESVTAIGRPGVRRGKTVKRFAASLALSAAMGAAMGGAGAATNTPLMQMPSGPVFLPGNGSQVSDMVVSLDGNSIYVMDVESEDITAVKPDGTVAAILPIKSDEAARLWRPAKSPFIYHVTKSAISVIDPTKNTISKQIPIQKGFAATLLSGRNEFYLCDKASCDLWDAVTATSVQKLDRKGLSAYLASADETVEDVDEQNEEDTKQKP